MRNTTLLLCALPVTVVVWLLAAVNPQGPWATLLDNIHWTFSFTLGALMVWRARRNGHADEQAWRRDMAIGLFCLALGQWMWNLQVFLHWNPFPGPSDAAYLLPGLWALTAFARIARRRLPLSQQRLAALDVGGFALAGLALVLTLYLPRGSNSTALQLAVVTAYPVLLVSASAAALVTQLHLRLPWTWHWLAVFGGLIGQGIVWMQWNLNTLDNTLVPGSFLNLAFSLLALALGWGASGWTLRNNQSARFDRICEGSIRQLPLAWVAMTSVAVGLLVLDDSLPGALRSSLLFLALLALLSAPMRQSMQLGERDRLLEAERGLAESRARLEYLAHHDALTGLANLSMLRERANQAMAAADRTGQSVALLFIDLDQFKEVNDTLGHGTGDALLVHTARRLEGLVGDTDTVSRHGGDEFVIVLPGVSNVMEVVHVTDRITQLATQSADVDSHVLSMSMSVGVAFYPNDATSFDALLQCADMAMYQAKAAGRNACRFYEPEMRAETTERMQMRGHLTRAMERGELLLHYQPIMDLQSNAVIGAEALLRWQHPELGLVPPSRFIPVAEGSGLIVPIGNWVLLEACRQCAAWSRAGTGPGTMAVNLSVLQFHRGDLERTVVDALRRSGLPPDHLELEITESVLMKDRDLVTPTLERLRKLGVRIAIDDFGTGYSSLGYLKHLPADKLKIDRTLIGDIDTNTRDASVARAIVQMAHELGLVVIAEGVETQAQRQMLKNCGCDQAQGFLFSKPVAADQFDRLCRDGSTALSA